MPVVVHRTFWLGKNVTDIVFTADMICLNDTSRYSFTNLVKCHCIMLLFQRTCWKLGVDNDSLVVTKDSGGGFNVYTHHAHLVSDFKYGF